MSELKTIRMPRELGEKWLAALRSGEYKQAKGVLKQENDEVVEIGFGSKDVYPAGHCCLGVLQEVADGDCELSGGDSEGNKYAKLPSVEWLDKHKVMFKALRWDSQGEEVSVAKYPNTETDVYFLTRLDRAVINASELNDNGTSFEAIADLLEQHMEYVD